MNIIIEADYSEHNTLTSDLVNGDSAAFDTVE